MAARETVLTPQGLEDLKAKIELLRTERRREVAQRIKEAREFGDISENSEYDDAKNEQAMLEKQISDLEEKLRGARVIDEKQVDTDVVGVGVTVHVKDQKTDKSSKYRIVGSAEADPAESKLSNESPVGKALLGHKRGETITVPVPRGPARKLKITKIERAYESGWPRRRRRRWSWTTGGRSSSACVPRASTPSRTPSRAWCRSSACTRSTRTSPTARRPTAPTA